LADEPILGDLFASNKAVQDVDAVKLLAAMNLAPYVTLMERHSTTAPRSPNLN